MNCKVTYSIITLFASVVIFFVLKSKYSEQNSRLADHTLSDKLQFPRIRAHVYFATAQEILHSLRDAASSIGSTVESQENVGMDSKIQLIGNTSAPILCQIVPLGEKHNRVVLWTESQDQQILAETDKTIHAIQDYMDNKLIGG
jgi:hypothetical protein